MRLDRAGPLDAADAAERLAQNFRFIANLRFVRDVLVLAASAAPKIAGRGPQCAPARVPRLVPDVRAQIFSCARRIRFERVRREGPAAQIPSGHRDAPGRHRHTLVFRFELPCGVAFRCGRYDSRPGASGQVEQAQARKIISLPEAFLHVLRSSCESCAACHLSPVGRELAVHFAAHIDQEIFGRAAVRAAVSFSSITVSLRSRSSRSSAPGNRSAAAIPRFARVCLPGARHTSGCVRLQRGDLRADSLAISRKESRATRRAKMIPRLGRI